MSEKCKYLPDECWELIFDTLDHHIHFQPLSLVCKRFLSITNLLRRELTVTKPTILFHGKISGFLRRFSHLKSIDISHFHHPYCVISEIANSSLSNLQVLDISNQKRVPTKGLMKLGSSKMRTLKVLKCSYIETLLDTDLFVIATSLPCLEELDISYPLNIYAHSSDTDKRAVTDIGIDALSSNLKNLCKINLSGSDFISDKSLMLLSSNCSLLREIMIKECTFLTVDGINFLLNNSPNLSAISMSFLFSYRSLDIRWANTQTSSLSTLYLSNMDISDGFLNSLANARLPLKRLSFLHCAAFSFSGISLLLYTYQSLEYLALVVVPFLTDQNMCDLSKNLHSIVSISLSTCGRLGELTFFILLKNCPLLRDIDMEGTNLGKQNHVANFVKNPQIKSLKLALNLDLSDECLSRIGLSCPRLQLLDVCFCRQITGEGISEVLKSCPEIRQLQIDGCPEVKIVDAGSEVSKLEVLGAARSGINDEGLIALGKRCCNLQVLDLEGCRGMTTQGLVEVVRNCRSLREINLRDHLTSDYIVNFMPYARSSFREILVHSSDPPPESQRRLLLKHGVLID